MNVSIKIDKRLINDAEIDADGFAKGCIQAIQEETGMYLDKKSIQLLAGKESNTAKMVFRNNPTISQSQLPKSKNLLDE